jgi:GT2 family glycosyltransferase
MSNNFVSIIITHWASNDVRSDTMNISLVSLIKNTDYPHEIIVVDNGGSRADSQFFLDLVHEGAITTYIRNTRNMHFGYARNQGMALAQGNYICIADNDIEYKGGWLSKCVEILEAYPEEKIYATPFDYPTSKHITRYRTGELEYKGEKYVLSMRAGSNCFVIRRKDMEEIGGFLAHRVAGSKWTDQAVKKGYNAIVVPGRLAEDLGLRKGYDLASVVPIYLDVLCGEKLYFNEDERDKVLENFDKDAKFVRPIRYI